MVGKHTVILSVLLSFGCEKSLTDDSPEGAYKSFARIAQGEDYARMLGALSARTRIMLEEEAQALSLDGGAQGGVNPARLMFALANSPKLQEVTLVSKAGDKAVVHVVAGQEQADVTLLHEGGGWKIDLSSALSRSTNKPITQHRVI